MVRALGIVGADQPTIGLVLAISPKTLRKHFRRELELAVIEATATVAAKLYSLAQRGDVAACIFWMKTHGWSERIAIDLAADRDVQEMSDAEIEARIARLSRRPGAKVVRLVPPSVA